MPRYLQVCISLISSVVSLSINSQIIKFKSTEITNRNVHITCELTKTNYEHDLPKKQESNMSTVYT